MSNPVAADLFGGCGGLSLGLSKAGFRVLASVDIDPLAVESYRLNHPGTLVVSQDVRELDPPDMLGSRIDVGDLDLLAGCPPCQGFSAIRTLRGRRPTDDAANDLILEVLRFVEALRPKTVMLENVPGLAADERLARFRRSLDRWGYRHIAELFDAQNFGVPQRRRRFILLASRLGEVTFGTPAAGPSVRDAIGALGPPGLGADPLHDYREQRSERIKRLIRKIPEDGGGRTQLDADEQLACHKRTDGFFDVYGRMAWERPAPTITCGCINPSKGRFLHPEQHRAITLREAALLQGFPRDYRISLREGRYRAAELIGNAFPPPFAEAHARSLRLHLEAFH